jgi:hypothetical protein
MREQADDLGWLQVGTDETDDISPEAGQSDDVSGLQTRKKVHHIGTCAGRFNETMKNALPCKKMTALSQKPWLSCSSWGSGEVATEEKHNHDADVGCGGAVRVYRGLTSGDVKNHVQWYQKSISIHHSVK